VFASLLALQSSYHGENYEQEQKQNEQRLLLKYPEENE
jgi:hypothetical protein